MRDNWNDEKVRWEENEALLLLAVSRGESSVQQETLLIAFFTESLADMILTGFLYNKSVYTLATNHRSMFS